MTKREIASLFIKLIGVYFFAGSSFLFFPLLISVANIRIYDSFTFIVPLCQLIPVLIYLAVLFLLVVKSDILAAKLIKEDKNFNLSLLIDKDEIMMIAFCCIGLSLLIKVIPNIIFVFIQSMSYVRTSNMFPNNIQDSYWSQIGIPKPAP